jgi:hypothetical protein
VTVCCDGGTLRTVLQPAPQIRAVLQPAAQIVGVLNVGQGPSGPPGLNGVGDANYRHEQAVAAAVWDITHNLAKYPSVTVLDSAGTECEGALEYLSVNALRLTFAAAFGGVAYLN